ncbi:MAG: amidase [Verrucomicrobiota bacterium]
MTFRDWQQLSPVAAAREVHTRARSRLSPAQQRAAIALLRPEAELAAEFATSRATAGPLSGVPWLAKDLFDVAGWPTFAGSTFLPELRGMPSTDSNAVTALHRSGAVLAGKTHLHEFAYGITGENPNYGDCEHPHFPGRTTGGSSSGSVAVVAAGIVPLALGSDTGGSVRVPAAFCGLYGFRLTPHDAWIADAFPLAPSFDTAGWFTANAADMQTSLFALIGPPPQASQAPRGCYLELPGLDPEVAVAFRAAAARLAPAARPALRDELLHGFAPALDAYHTTVALEAWEVHSTWAERYRERYDPVVWPRLIRGRSLTTEQIDSSVNHRAAIRALWQHYFKAHDFLVLPASPFPALTKAECTLENRNRVITVTAPASIGGLPVLTIPVPLPGGLTTGLQIVVNQSTSPAIPWALAQFS